jgi:cobalt/nickel transport protein
VKRWPIRSLLALAFVIAIGIATWLRPHAEPSEWPGVDDAVIGRFVREAGHPPPQPLIEWVHGDLLLFAFLCAGLLAGFLIGYFGRALFAERPDGETRRGEHG